MRFDLRPARTQPIVKPVRANAWVGANGNEVTVDVPSKETDQLIARVVEREGPCPKTQSASIVIAMTAVAVAFCVVIVVLLNVQRTAVHVSTVIKEPLNEMLNISVSAAEDVGATLENVLGMSDGTRMITDYSAGEIIEMVNSTKNIVTRMEAMLAHPNLNLELVPRIG